MPLTPYACANCGHWQRWFAPPPGCPVCTDVRNALPEDGWEFVPAADLAARTATTWRDVLPGVTEFAVTPTFGLDSRGWLLETEGGPLAWEAAAFYSADALAEIAGRGGIRTLGSSHVHGYGALWQLQDEFAPPVVAVGVEDLVWTKAFRVTWPVDEELLLAPGITAYQSGGHFPGHLLLHDATRGLLFCGDALKVDLDDAGEPRGLSCHKAYHAQIPLSHGEVRHYRSLVERLEFDVVLTPFECVKGITREDVLALLDAQLAGPPSAAVIPLSGLR